MVAVSQLRSKCYHAVRENAGGRTMPSARVLRFPRPDYGTKVCVLIYACTKRVGRIAFSCWEENAGVTRTQSDLSCMSQVVLLAFPRLRCLKA